MNQPFGTQNLKTRTALLLFIKGSAAPLVLYFDNAKEVYEELSECLKCNISKFVEKEPTGPVKKVSFQTSQISAIALQEETYIQQ